MLRTCRADIERRSKHKNGKLLRREVIQMTIDFKAFSLKEEKEG